MSQTLSRPAAANPSPMARQVRETVRYWRDYLWSRFNAGREKDLFKDVRTYCMFIGYPRSGHSLCGALLNAHPEMMLAHELDALMYVDHGIARDQLYALILKRDRWFTRQRECKAVDFNFHVPNQWQGRFRQLTVIGDKQGGLSTVRLQKHPHLLARLRRIVQVPLKIIHIVRNPFDNISTMIRRRGGTLDENIRSYFVRVDTNARLIAADTESEIITLRHEDLIARPTESLKLLVSFIGLDASEDYLADCAGIVFDSPSRSRQKMEWPAERIAEVQAKIDACPFLRGYSFDN